jgi:hypothetical protein
VTAELAPAAPHAKTPGESVPAQTRMMGPRAARACMARLGSGGPPLRRAPAPAAASPRPTRAVARSGVLVAGLMATLFGKRIQR